MNDNLINNIICPKCGTSNAAGSAFCVNCGNSLQPQNMNVNQNITNNNESVNSFQQVNNLNEQQINQITTVEQPVNNVENTMQQQNTNKTNENFNFFQYLIGAVLKPFNTYKKEENNLNDTKNVSILSLIVVGIFTVLKLITIIISTVREKSYFSDEVKWVWENLKEISFIKVIGQNILIYAGIILAIAGIYFLASLVIKKETKFVKTLSATVTAFIPYTLAVSVLSPVLSMIYAPLGIIISLIGFVYMLMILLELMNEIIVIENKNTRIYFHLTCLSILLIGGGFIAYKVLLGSLSSSIGSLGSIFE